MKIDGCYVKYGSMILFGFGKGKKNKVLGFWDLN